MLDILYRLTILLRITNKIQRYTIFLIIANAWMIFQLTHASGNSKQA